MNDLERMQNAAMAYLRRKWGEESWDDFDFEFFNKPMEFNLVRSNIAVGSAIHTADDVARLKSIGVTHVICCAEEHNERDRELLKDTGIEYLAAGFDDDLRPKPVSVFKAPLAYALKALKRKDAMLYVHCNMGINRAPAIAYAILRALGLTVPEAQVAMLARPRPEGWAANPYFLSADVAVVELGYAAI